jgi:hypothetical protein
VSVEGLSRIGSKLETLFLNKHLSRECCEPGGCCWARGTEWRRADEIRRLCPRRRVDAVHLVSRRCEVVTRVSRSASCTSSKSVPRAADCCGAGGSYGKNLMYLVKIEIHGHKTGVFGIRILLLILRRRLPPTCRTRPRDLLNPCRLHKSRNTRSDPKP